VKTAAEVYRRRIIKDGQVAADVLQQGLKSSFEKQDDIRTYML
jgi:hypothetical protein